MTSTRNPHEGSNSKPGDDTSVAPADWVKPVELIELLQRRAAKQRRQVKAPTSSPLYDADFVAKHPKTKRKRCKTAN